MPQYRKKSIVVEAFILGVDAIPDWFMDKVTLNECFLHMNGDIPHAEVKTLEGTMIAYKNEYIIKGIQGEIYPCKPDIFEATYDRVE